MIARASIVALIAFTAVPATAQDRVWLPPSAFAEATADKSGGSDAVDDQRPRDPSPRPQKPRPVQPRVIVPGEKPFGIRGYGAFGSTTLDAEHTFQAVAGTNRRPNGGGGAQVTKIWKDIFADVGVSQLRLDGERVFVDARNIYKLGIPLEVTMRSVDVTAGWRFRIGRISPYAGAGLTHLSYEETSQFAAANEDVSETGTGPIGLAGVDVSVLRWLHVGGELRYRQVEKVLGEAGVSKEFDERSAGGLSAGLRVSIVLR